MRKFCLSFFILILLFYSPITYIAGQHTAFAATTDYVDQDFPEAMDKAKQEDLRDMNAVGHVASVNTTMYSDLIRRIAGPIKGVTTLSTNTKYLQQMYRESFVYGADQVVAYMYQNPPANTYAFVLDMGQSLGFIPKTAYAQGIGFSGLSPLLPMWKAFRNIAYLLLALFMIFIGFLIMFRKKIDPKTVVTVQNALPNIVVTLLLITFSYAIVGIMIDLMYLLIMIAISILIPISKGVITIESTQTYIYGNFWEVIRKMWGSYSVLNDVIALFGNYVAIGSVAVPGVIGFIATLFTGSVGSTLIGAAAVPLLLLVILFIAIVIACIRLLFLLVSAYIQIIFSLLISPFQLLLGAFPGSHAFENWIKNLIANLAVFPITAILLLIGNILAKANYGTARLWTPPFLATAVGSSGLGLESGLGLGGGMGGIIGLGILFAIPTVAGSIKEALKAKPMAQVGPGAVLGPLGTGAGQAMNYLYQISMISHYLPRKKGATDNTGNAEA